MRRQTPLVQSQVQVYVNVTCHECAISGLVCYTYHIIYKYVCASFLNPVCPSFLAVLLCCQRRGGWLDICHESRLQHKRRALFDSGGAQIESLESERSRREIS